MHHRWMPGGEKCSSTGRNRTPCGIDQIMMASPRTHSARRDLLMRVAFKHGGIGTFGTSMLAATASATSRRTCHGLILWVCLEPDGNHDRGHLCLSTTQPSHISATAYFGVIHDHLAHCLHSTAREPIPPFEPRRCLRPSPLVPGQRPGCRTRRRWNWDGS